MATSELVLSTTTGARTTILLNSPETRNALSEPMLAAFRDALASVPTDSRVVTLGHTGTVFSAGLDLKAAVVGPLDLSSLAATIAELRALQQTTVACVNGAIRAGGIALAASCDLVVVASQTTFAFTEVNIGAVPALVSSAVFRRVSPARITEAFLTGVPISAVDALQLGLVNSVAADPLARTDKLVEALLSAAPTALVATTALLRNAMAGQQPELAELQAISESAFASVEAQEGIRAFLEKCPPTRRR